tara:strand:+ start:379 stop:558 length:180 start_codon:yes stop_codon:yes gene_type:complete
MSTLRDRINSHLPVVLQVISTASLVVIALSAICGSKSLKELAGAHAGGETTQMIKGHKN